MEHTYPFYSVDGRWVYERGGLLALCWQTSTQARGKKPAPAPCGVSALGRCQSPENLIFKAASEVRFGSVNFTSHAIDGELLIKQNISFFLLTSR